MIGAVDVSYAGDRAVAGCTLFEDWSASGSSEEHVARWMNPAPYVPGRFYLRELPCLMAVLDRLTALPEVLIVDGYVWLDEAGSPGLGAHLWRAVGENCAIVGVAKSSFRGSRRVSRAVVRGRSARPLHVSAAGMSVDEAANHVESMPGNTRMPTLLRHVDHLARQASRECLPRRV